MLGNGFSTTFFHRMIFQKKYFTYYILLTGEISLSDCLYFLKSLVAIRM